MLIAWSPGVCAGLQWSSLVSMGLCGVQLSRLVSRGLSDGLAWSPGVSAGLPGSCWSPYSLGVSRGLSWSVEVVVFSNMPWIIHLWFCVSPPCMYVIKGGRNTFMY